jgi:hypothetical protein
MIKKASLILFVIAIILSSLSSLQAANPKGKISNFEVQDAPYDDGSGIMLSWKPLPRDLRIIQYRIYRGITPDTLFFFGQVEVDPTAGVTADKMFYYDKDYQLLLTIDSPSRLKKEKQQPAGSPLYGKVPRDPAILNRLFPYLTVLGVVDQANFYKHSIKVTGKDGTVSAGLRPAQFKQIAANPVAGMRYYYTVLAVDEKGTYLPYADIKSAVPQDNPPDLTAQVSGIYLKDKSQFRLEWTSPASSYDIARWQFWLVPASARPALQQWQNVYQQKGGQPAPWTANAVLLAEKPNDYNNFLIIDTAGGRVINPDGSPGAAVPAAALQNYLLVMAVQDYSGMTSYTEAAELGFLTSDQLPNKTIFRVADKPDDKGDTNALSFGQPICFITQAAYLNTKKTRIRINYELSENLQYKIDAVRFQITDGRGKLLATINERYPDKIITLKLKQPDPALTNLQVKMAFRYRGKSQYTDYYVQQALSYDLQTRRFRSEDVFYKGEDLSRNYYQVYRKSLLESGFLPAKKISTISRNYDDIISFETTLQKLVSGVDVRTGRLLLDPTLSFALDKETGMPLSVNIFRDEEAKELQKTRDEIAALKQQLLTNPAKADSLNQEIALRESYLKALTSHPVYKAAGSIKNPLKWLSLFHREQLKNSRSYAYMIMKTDTKGAFTFSEESQPYLPVSNWFNWNFLLALIASVVFTFIVLLTSYNARRGRDLYLRPIAGLQEIDNAVGRATEMGRPIMYIPGWSTIGEITTIASMMILNRVARKAAEYDTRIMVPNNDYYVMPLAQEMVRDAFYEAGRPDSYNPVDIFYISSDQFPWAAGINGTMIREKTATNFYMGFFNAEALLMTETGNATGSIQIAGTDSITQVPFFITTCDYTLIGEEFYAASAYLSKDAELVAMLKAQDYFKFLIVFFVILGAVLSTLHFNWLTNAFPLE